MEIVWRVSGRCPVGVVWVSGGCLKGILRVSGRCPVGVCRLQGRCLKSVGNFLDTKYISFTKCFWTQIFSNTLFCEELKPAK